MLNSIHAPHYMQLSRKWRGEPARPPKGSLCPGCGKISQFNNITCNWVRPDASVILNNHYQVKVCVGCGHRIYPDKMLQVFA